MVAVAGAITDEPETLSNELGKKMKITDLKLRELNGVMEHPDPLLGGAARQAAGHLS